MSISRIMLFLAMGMFSVALGRGVGLVASWSSGPRVEITPTQVDLGAVVVGQSIEQIFMIRNTGMNRLLITDIQSTCQCTVAELSTRVIATGKSIPLRVTFTGKSAGLRSQTVTVRTNDTEAPTRLIKLQALVIAPQLNKPR